MILHLPVVRGAHDWASVVRNEYTDCPGLALTEKQIQRLCGLDARTCQDVIAELLNEHFLHRMQNGVLVHEGGN
jgi:hypothetical protein